MREAYDLHRAHGADVELLDDAPACRARVDSPTYRAGFVDRNVGLVDPAKLLWGLARAAESHGVRIHEDTSVTGFEEDGSGVRVRTEWGSIHAQRVVIGTNAYRGVLKRFSAWVLPVYDHVLMTEPLSPAQLDAMGVGFDS